MADAPTPNPSPAEVLAAIPLITDTATGETITPLFERETVDLMLAELAERGYEIVESARIAALGAEVLCRTEDTHAAIARANRAERRLSLLVDAIGDPNLPSNRFPCWSGVCGECMACRISRALEVPDADT